MRTLFFLFVVFFSFQAFAGGPEEGKLFGIQLGKAISLNRFIEPNIDDRLSPDSPLYEFTRFTQKSLKLNEDMLALGLQQASAYFETETLKVQSLSAQSTYETFDLAQKQAKAVCETFSKKYGGDCPNLALLSPEELLANSLWPIEFYYNDFDRRFALSMYIGRRKIPGTQGVIENYFQVHYEIFRDRYQECLNSFKEPDYFGLNQGQDPITECAKLKK